MKKLHDKDTVQQARVGDLVRPAGDRAAGKYSKGGLICRIVEVGRVRQSYRLNTFVWRYKIKPIWGLFDSHKRKQSWWGAYDEFEVLDLVTLGRQCLELQNLTRDHVRIKSGAEEEDTEA